MKPRTIKGLPFHDKSTLVIWLFMSKLAAQNRNLKVFDLIGHLFFVCIKQNNYQIVVNQYSNNKSEPS